MHLFQFIFFATYMVCALAYPPPLNLHARQTSDGSIGYTYAVATIQFCTDTGGTGDDCTNMSVPAVPPSGGGAAVDTIMNPAIEINYSEIPQLDKISAITVTGTGIQCFFGSQLQSRNPYNICGPQTITVSDGQGQVNLDTVPWLNDVVRCLWCVAPAPTSSK